jgi:CO dehydrogenase/acetyl-CoA synthase alpha subunit
MKLRAPLLLGWHAVRWLTGSARFWRGDGPLQEFLHAYEADGIRPLTPDERTHLPSWHACTACGLCDLACPEDKAPMLVAAAMQRDIPRHRHYAAHASALTACGACNECEAICPAGVPILNVAAFVASAAD